MALREVITNETRIDVLHSPVSRDGAFLCPLGDI